MADTSFLELATLCKSLEATKKKKEIARLIGNFLKALPGDDVPLAASLILGRAFAQKPLDISGAAVVEILPGLIGGKVRHEPPFPEAHDFGEAIRVLLEHSGFVPSGEGLTIKRVLRAFGAIAETKGAGSRRKKREALLNLLRSATPQEAEYIVKNVIGEMRIGVDEGMVLQSLSSAYSIPINLLQRAAMLLGDITTVAGISHSEGAAGLEKTGLVLFRPIKPMLAETASSVSDAFASLHGSCALEYKLDGARVQVHKQGGRCRLFSRNLTDITESFPEVAEEIRRNLQSEGAIVEGEIIAVDADGRPLPFQVLMRRLGRVRELEKLKKEVPVRYFLFDILDSDGEVLIDMPYDERWSKLEQTALPVACRIVPATSEEGEAFFRKAIAEGYEGVMAKELSSLYTPGTRGKTWMKIKKVLSLDLVITAADWGYGRRHGWLSNYHLAAHDEKSRACLAVGKTFKGLTDREFQEMTARLLALRTGESRETVFVRPEVVAEVLFSDVQKSPRYESGYALRFARIARIRDDKPVREIDTIQTVQSIYARQSGRQKTAALK